MVGVIEWIFATVWSPVSALLASRGRTSRATPDNLPCFSDLAFRGGGLVEFPPLPTSLTLRDRHIDERHAMSSTQAAVVLGASGSVGNALIKELIRNGSFKTIVTLVRRSRADQVAMARENECSAHEPMA
jgi:NADPH:quinone reductase-like Zn-dependent oxidoreductase